jgi:outer membrane protein assembly factor BamB
MAVAAAAALGMVAVTGASASGAATNTPPRPAAKAAAAAVPGTQLWMKHYRNVNVSIPDYDNQVWAAASPTGRTVFVTGSSYGGSATGWDYATVAYNADTGKQLWATRYNGPANRQDFAHAVAVSPNGGMVFVTGETYTNSRSNFATVAYNAATGKQLWAKRYGSSGDNAAYSVAVSPGGGRVFITGVSAGQYGTVAYRAHNGRQLWVARYHGPGNGSTAFSIAASPTERTVFVTGESAGPDQRGQYATLAYDAATGKQLWVQRYGNGRAHSVAVSPGGGRVFVTGENITTASGGDYATVAYRADNGRQLWVTRYNGPANQEDVARSVVASPTERTVFVTGSCDGSSDEYGSPVGNDYATVAYDAATGTQLWATRYNGPGNDNDYANSMAVSPTGQTVFVTGESLGTAHVTDYATLAYNAATGKQLWLQRYGPGSASSIAASPRGQVFVTGPTGANDYTTIAYGS